MKILFLNYEYPPLGGGAGNATEYLLKEYAQVPDLEVHLVTSSADDKAHEATVGDQVFVHSLPIGKSPQTLHFQSIFDVLRYSWAGYRFARKLLSPGDFDAIHAFFSVPCGVQAYLLGRRFKIPYIVSLRGADVPGYSERFSFLYIFLKPIIRFVWKHSAFVVANSEGLRELALRTNREQPIDVIHNGIDSNHFSPRPEARPEDAFIITLGASRVTMRKGVQYLIEAVSMLVAKSPQIRLKILGDGDDKERLENMVKVMKLESHVMFLGRIPREETAPYYQEASVFVLPSQNEGMSNALLEALASGLPIIATDTGGSKELVADGENGFIVKMRSAEDIAEKLARLIADPALRQRFGEASRTRAEKMSWKNIARQYVEVYRNIS
ncbi:MAG: glycosyltransferase family 4 protein [Patescibacteria group bacterium]